MAYKKGDHCVTCKREVIYEECSICKGTGKPPNAGWAAVQTTCPACGGKGAAYKCPVILPLDVFIKGKRCSEVSLAEEEPGEK